MESLVAVVGSRGLIEERITGYAELLIENGFTIVEQDTMELTEAQAQLLLGQSEGQVEAFTSGPCVAFLLKRVNAYATFNSLRLELDYTYGSLTGWMALRDRAAFFPAAEPVLERVLLLVKPGYEASAGGNVYAEVSRILEENDFVILTKEMKLLGIEAASTVAVVQESKEELEYLTSNMSIILVVEKIGAIQELQLLIGPNSPEEARLYAPHTLRGSKFGSGDSAVQAWRNLVYASDSTKRSRSDLALFLPNPLLIERTILVLKPDIVVSSVLTSGVIEVMNRSGFTIQSQEQVYLSRARAEGFLKQRSSSSSSSSSASSSSSPAGSFESAAQFLSSGPCLVLVLSKPSAVSTLLMLLGPEDPVQARLSKPLSLRARIGGVDTVHNALYASYDRNQARKDIEEFFPSGVGLEDNLPQSSSDLQQLLSSKPGLDASFGAPHRGGGGGGGVSSESSLYEVLLQGLTQLCRVKPTGNDAVLYLSDWLLENNPNKPKVIIPEEITPVLSLAEEIETTSSSASASVESTTTQSSQSLNISWLISSPGINKTDLIVGAMKDLANSASGSGILLEHISTSGLLKSLERTSGGTEYSQIVSEYIKTNRMVPPHILTPLLVRAIRASPSKRIIISAFPYSLDQSFDLEKAVGAAIGQQGAAGGATKQLIYLECHKAQEAQLAARALAANPNLDQAAFARKLKSFNEDIQPVIEHYDLFQKVKRINAGVEEEEEVLKQLKKLLAK